MIILLVDDHAMMRHGLRAVLEKELDVQHVDEASNGREAVEIARRTHPERRRHGHRHARPERHRRDARDPLGEPRGEGASRLSMNSDRRYVARDVRGGGGRLPR